MQFCVCLTLILTAASIIAAEPADVARPAIQSAGSDERGRIVVNGQPFFPILMYDVPTDEDSLKMFRERGFNTLSATVDDAEKLRKQGFYTAAHAAETKDKNLDGVLFGVGMDSPALNWKDGLHEKVRDDLAKMKAMFPKRPIFHAIGYWEDEPAGVFENKLPSKEKYDDLVKLLDVSAPYLYPIPYHPVTTVGDAVRRADAAGAGKKPLLPVLQLFTWKPEDRYPTPAELRCMVYLSLIHGADGIGYYSYNYVSGKTGTNIAKEQLELWSAVKEINQEIQRISQWPLDSAADDKTRVTADRAAVFYRTGRRDLPFCLLINISDQPQPVTIEWSVKAKRAYWQIDRSRVKLLEATPTQLTLEPHQGAFISTEHPPDAK